MKHRKALMTLVIALTLVCGITIGANASSTLKQISAYLNYGISIRYKGEIQTLADANGNLVYPITYEGTTYLPVRSVANLLGIDVSWDQTTQTVLLGGGTNSAPSAPADNTPSSVDLIENFKPYTSYVTEVNDRANPDPEFLQSGDQLSTDVGGVTVDHWLNLRNFIGSYKPVCSFNLGGKYGTLTFKVYTDKDVSLTVKGDNDSVLGEFSLKEGQVPQTLTVDLRNTAQLTFACDKVREESYYTGNANTYIFDAVLN